MSDDIVAELERFMTGFLNHGSEGNGLLQRARDELVRLRGAPTPTALRIRAEALEEAARVCEHRDKPVQDVHYRAGVQACVGAIRALKDIREKQDDGPAPEQQW